MHEDLPEARRYDADFMEQQRPQFEAEIRANWPNRSLERHGTSYCKNNTRNQWLGWLACARRVQK
jgi:hypothetical protein